MPRNPVDGVARLYKPKRTPTALTATKVNAIRAVIKAWEQSPGTSGPNPDGQLVEVMLELLRGSAKFWRSVAATSI